MMIKKSGKVVLIATICLAVCLAAAGCFDGKESANKPQDIITKQPETTTNNGNEKETGGSTENGGKETGTGEVTLGEVNGNVYSNDYFGFEFAFPDDLDKVYSRDEVMVLTNGFNKVGSSEEIDLGEQGQLFLFGARGNNNIFFLTVQAFKIGAVTILGEITTAEEFLENNIGFDGEYEDLELNDIESTKLGSKDFKYWEQSFGTEQIYDYVCEADGYLIEFNASTRYNAGKEDIESFINSINFK